MRLLALTLLCCACACQATPDTQPAPATRSATADPLSAFAGRWVRRGPRNIIGRGRDEVWMIARSAEGWTIQLTLVHHPSVNDRSRQSAREEFAAVPLVWNAGCLEFHHPGSSTVQRRITVELRDDQLFMPAFVQHDERTWEFRSWSEGGVFHFEHDPRVVASGTVTHPFHHWIGASSVYRTREVASVWDSATLVQAAQIFQINQSGAEELCGELVFELPPHSPLARTPYDSGKFSSAPHERLSEQQWSEIQLLPPFERRD
ncbi:MAG: hypothetical protein JNL28_09625 [Planctomycetes bacterium]|nr:hypothetical protein [Planctomycetota bacterium]